MGIIQIQVLAGRKPLILLETLRTKVVMTQREITGVKLYNIMAIVPLIQAMIQTGIVFTEPVIGILMAVNPVIKG